MNIYIAAPWIERERLPEIARKVTNLGHVITHEWWITEDKPFEAKNHAYLETCAQLDRIGVKTADLLIVLNWGKSEGKAVEQGIAIALGKPILIVGTLGEFNNIFHYLPSYRWVATVDEALKVLETVDWMGTSL